MAENQSYILLGQEWLRLDKVGFAISVIEKQIQINLPLVQSPETRAEIQTLLDAGNTAELKARLGKRIEFGTAGIYDKMV